MARPKLKSKVKVKTQEHMAGALTAIEKSLVLVKHLGEKERPIALLVQMNRHGVKVVSEVMPTDLADRASKELGVDKAILAGMWTKLVRGY